MNGDGPACQCDEQGDGERINDKPREGHGMLLRGILLADGLCCLCVAKEARGTAKAVAARLRIM